LVHPLMNTFKNFGLTRNSFNPFSPFVQLAFNNLLITPFLSTPWHFRRASVGVIDRTRLNRQLAGERSPDVILVVEA